MKDLFLTRRFFQLFGIVIGVFVLAFPFRWLFPVAQTVFVFAVGAIIAEYLLLFGKNISLHSSRHLPRLFSLSDANRVTLEIENPSAHAFQVTVIDELPPQLQQRNFEIRLLIPAVERITHPYEITPLTRGEYHFGDIHVFADGKLGLLQRRFRSSAAAMTPVYPSIIQMKRYELRAMHQIAHETGIKRLRRLGHSYEFEQIKNYVQGDDYRSINWKASGRRASLMVNQYEDERAQQAYCLIDKSRVMKMPFNGLSLLDYSINASLVMSNIILQKGDKAGLLTFSDTIGTMIRAERNPQQLTLILQALYNETQRPVESSYELLYHTTRKLIKGRSLLLLFTNFESMPALDRVLPLLRMINTFHLLVIVFFENTEIAALSRQAAANVEEIYYQTIAQKFLYEKTQMVQKLRQHGIQAILTRPEDLSINTINKYLELKARGFI